ncbi:MAG: peptidylprolyl isomerase [Candidatus Thiocaldithrix dubininis]|uniref:Peptidyl-prolyl cis-trans isomerase n=1 Tax=Candidatus Thiocaldithrix dubininis TaxID=3080823 RepID=A0AA95KFN6_9GAMM|nr:MAG: peptidylprolyl isomerase [Candidatus Thiocaldithrix dubininis]
MQIAPNTVVTMTYTLTNAEGQVLDQADASHPFVYMQGAHNIIPGLEQALAGKQAGDTAVVTVQPEDAYGEYNEQLTQQVPRQMFGNVPEDQLVVGAQFQAQTNGGVEIITIADVDGDMITIDANHPLAGETLTFDVRILDVRAATPEEIEHGHAHGPGGHHH